LAALGCILGLWLSSGRGLWCCGCTRQLADGREQYPPMPTQDADLFEVLVGKMGEYGNVNLILSKSLSVLPKTELFEPVCNLMHRVH
jgi:hypothetical protein